MQGQIPDRHIHDWDETDVHNWLTSLGFSHYESQIRDNDIRGDSLCTMQTEHLRLLGIPSVGQRLSILKYVYLVKLAHNVPIGEEDYVPPSESTERSELSADKLNSIVKDQAQRLRNLEDENRTLGTRLQSLAEDFSSFRSSLGRPENPQDTLRRQPSFKWAQYVNPQKSPTKVEVVESPHPSPQRTEHDPSAYNKPPGPSMQTPPSTTDKPRATPSSGSEVATANSHLKPGRQESTDNLKSFKVSLEDPTWKVLPAALKKYRINNDNWQNYAMFICYGSPGNRIERCLSYDEKPLLLFQKLKDAKKNPVFMLKHIKDIRSPIAVAQQKHAARKASSVISQETTATSGHHKNASTSRTGNRPPRLEVQDFSASTPTMSTGLSPQPGWPDVSSPAAETQRSDDITVTPPSAASTQTSHPSTTHTSMSGSTLVGTQSDSKRPTDQGESNSSSRDMPIANSGVSYAVAIYPYMAEQDDEFDVVVGDTFVILSRARGWWVVQRDPTGSGIVDPDTSKQGWVPAGCLLETNVPVAAAIAEATAKNGIVGSDEESASRTPILPLSIISTSFPGIALMDYKKKGEEELDLVKDDALRVFKRYNHWSYAVKEVGGDRGWVPSWFIGKVSATGVVPATPSSSIPPLPPLLHLDDGPHQVSPMSSAFPPVQTRSNPTVV